MLSPKQRLRLPVSVLVALSVAITLTLSSYAAPSVAVPGLAAPSSHDGTPVPVQAQRAQAGTLTATGPVTVNGNQAATGMTILTGSAIATGPGGRALMELGPLGRAELGQGTGVTLQMLGNVQEASLTQCGDLTVTLPTGITGRVTIPQPYPASVRVAQGKVTVKYDTNLEKVLVAGNNQAFDNVIEVVSDGGAAVVEVSCGQGGLGANPGVGGGAAGQAGSTGRRGLPFSPWWFLLAVPVGVGIGLGVSETSGGAPPVLSPVVPG